MTAREKIATLLPELGSLLGTDLVLEEGGVCTLLFGDTLTCILQAPEEDARLSLLSPLIDVPADGRAEILELALSLNLHGLETGGAMVAYDGKHNAVVLCHLEPVEGLDALGLKNVLGNFLGVAQRLKTRLEEIPGTAGDAAAEGRKTGSVAEMMMNPNLRG